MHRVRQDVAFNTVRVVQYSGKKSMMPVLLAAREHSNFKSGKVFSKTGERQIKKHKNNVRKLPHQEKDYH